MAEKKSRQDQCYLQVPNVNKTTITTRNVNNKENQNHQQQIQKKHSGPLDEALNELSKQQEQEEQFTKTTIKSIEPTIATIESKTNENKLPELRHLSATNVIKKEHAHTHTHPHLHTHQHAAHLRGGGGVKRERWLLTRKTWKFMQDAGRKLLPDNVQNRKEDIPLIEAHFQELCANEQRFLLWRRKVSFPGARRTSLRNLTAQQQWQFHMQQRQKRRLPGLRGHQRPRQAAQQQSNVNQIADQTLQLLKDYLQLNDHTTTTTALLSSKTQQPHQTVSPSSQRPMQVQHQHNQTLQQQQQQQQDNKNAAIGNEHEVSISNMEKNLQLEQLLAKLKNLSTEMSDIAKSTTSTNMGNISSHCVINWLPKSDMITRDLLENKTLLRQIYNELKRQQLHRQLTVTSPTPSILLRRTHSFNNGSSFMNMHPRTSNSSYQFNLNKQINNDDSVNKELMPLPKFPPTDFQLTTNNTTYSIDNIASPNPKPHENSSITQSINDKTDLTKIGLIDSTTKSPSSLAKNRRIKLNTCGTQTNFIPLQEIKQLANDYREIRQQTQQDQQKNTSTNIDDGSAVSSARKSSIENADISPTVSDTIKRYLRMARKKSVSSDKQQEEEKARFKRINYDRQLRQIRARGEINPPGMDENNNKAIQTLDAWPLIMLDFIRNNESDYLNDAHCEWEQQLNERLERKNEYEKKYLLEQQQQQQQQQQQTIITSFSTTPTTTTKTSKPRELLQLELFDQAISTNFTTNTNTNTTATTTSSNASGSRGSNLLLSSQQFLSNLWHGTNTTTSSTPELSSSSSNTNNNKSYLNQKSKFSASQLFHKHCRYTI